MMSTCRFGCDNFGLSVIYTYGQIHPFSFLDSLFSEDQHDDYS